MADEKKKGPVRKTQEKVQNCSEANELISGTPVAKDLCLKCELE